MDVRKLLIIPDIDNIDTSIDIARKYNCGFEYNDFFMPNVLDNKEVIDDTIKQYLGTANIPDYCTMHGAFLDVTIFSQDSKIFEVSDYRVEQSIAIAKKIGAKAIIFHTNYMPNFKQKAYRNNWVESNARYWSEKLKKHPGIDIYIENMFDEDWELMLELGEKMGDKENFGLCLDYAHACVFGNEKQISEWCKRLGPYVKHIHINDNDLVSDLHQALGSGKIDWDCFKRNYQTYLTNATVLVEMNGIENIRTSLEYISAL